MRSYSAHDLLAVRTEHGQYSHYCLRLDWTNSTPRTLCGLSYGTFFLDSTLSPEEGPDEEVCVRCRGYLSA